MNAAEDSPKTPESYSGLNLEALYSIATGNTVVEAQASACPDKNIELEQRNRVQGDPAQQEKRQRENAQAGNGNNGQDERAQDENGQGVKDGSHQSESISLPPPSDTSMQDYYQLQQNLLGLTVVLGAVIFPFVWGFYSLQIALNYILGACAGVVYLRMLGKNVGQIGRNQKNSSAGRLAVFAGIMIVALRWNQLAVIPVFLGFLTYKAAIIAFVLWTSVMSSAKVS